MSLRLEMLQVARLATKPLGDSVELVRRFLSEELHEEGGFKNRNDEPDLYYTVFGLGAYQAVRSEIPGFVVPFLTRQTGEASDGLVETASLARCWASLPSHDIAKSTRERLLENLDTFRSPDGGYKTQRDSPSGTVYGCFLALGAYQDLDSEIPDPEKVCDFVRSMQAEDGGFSNRKDRPAGTTTATAAAMALLRNLHSPLPTGCVDWLLDRFHEKGGFVASPSTPLPDLLSTATALHALGATEYPIEEIREPCLDFLDSLWTNRGSFYAHWADTDLDCEYTFYGLLALGHLSL